MRRKEEEKEKREAIKLRREKRSVSGATREGQEEQRKERGHAKDGPVGLSK